MSDCEWLRDLHSVGLLSPSFRAADEIVALRSYMRQRESLVQEAPTHIQRMHKALTEMNLLLHVVKYHPKFPPFYHLKLPHLFPCWDLNCSFGPRQHKLAGFAQSAIRAAKRPVFFAACGGARYLFWLPSIIGLVTGYGLRAVASGSSTPPAPLAAACRDTCW